MALEISLQVEIEQAIAAIEHVRRDQLPYAISLAVNETAKAAQREVRAHIRQAFTLRRPQFVLNTVKIEKYDFANKRNPTVFRLKIDDQVYKNSRRRDFLAKFEEAGEKTATDDVAFPIAIPTKELRPSFRELVRPRFYPGNLRLAPKRVGAGEIIPARQKRTSGGVVQWQGKLRTFVLDPRFHGEQRGGEGDPTWGVYQRTGPGKHDIRLLWTYARSVPIPPLLQFYATAQQAIRSTFQLNFSYAYARAMATARPI
jgi:hypothetical protein